MVFPAAKAGAIFPSFYLEALAQLQTKERPTCPHQQGEIPGDDLSNNPNRLQGGVSDELQEQSLSYRNQKF